MLAQTRRHVRELERLLDDERSRAQRLAELNHAKSQFLTIASHELRSPLTVLTGHLSLLEEGAFGEIPQALAGIFPVLNARLAEMESCINAMLETARLDDDQLNLLRAPVDLREVIAEALHRNELFLHPGQRLLMKAPERPLVIVADRTRLGVAISSVVNNAIKHSPRHTDVRVDVVASDNAIDVNVIDTGIGIAPQDMPVLFTRFGRVRSDAAVSALPGAGLGLYLARELMRAHGGDITVVSEPRSGSTFTLSLPR